MIKVASQIRVDYSIERVGNSGKPSKKNNVRSHYTPK